MSHQNVVEHTISTDDEEGVLSTYVPSDSPTEAGGTTTTGDTSSPPATVDVPSGAAATLVRGLDGDSFRVDIDSRWRMYARLSFRRTGDIAARPAIRLFN